MMSHMITWMIVSPLIAAFLQAISPKTSRWISIFGSLISTLFALVAVLTMGSGEVSVWQISEIIPWVGSYAISYEVALDGMNALLVLLIAIVFPLLLVSEWSAKSGVRGLHGLLLLMQAALLGVVCAQDVFLIFFFWAMTALPFFFLIAIWGGEKREEAAFRYIVSTSIGNALFFVGMVLVYYSVEPHTFSLGELIGGRVEGSRVPFLDRELSISRLAFVLIGLSFLFRLPVWPLHSWFTHVVTQAPASVSVALCGVFVPVGTYLFARLGISLFPSEMLNFSWFIMAVGGANILFGALIALSQRDLRLLLAFLCISQVGILMVGVGSLVSAGVVGSIYQQLVLGLGLAGFALMIGLISRRVGSLEFIDEKGKRLLGGMILQAPILSFVGGVLIASLLGFPGLGGFVGQSLIIMGGYSIQPWVILSVAIGLILLTLCLFQAFRNLFLGEARGAQTSDLTFREKMVLFPIVLVIVFLGVYPKPLLDIVRPTVLDLISAVR